MPDPNDLKPGSDTGLRIGEPDSLQSPPVRAAAMLLRFLLFSGGNFLMGHGVISAKAGHMLLGLTTGTIGTLITFAVTYWAWLVKQWELHYHPKPPSPPADPPSPIEVPAPNDPHPLADFVNTSVWTSPWAGSGVYHITATVESSHKRPPKRKAAKKRKR